MSNVIQGSGTAVINCHKHMLAAQSPVFAQLFLQAANSSQSLTSVSGKVLILPIKFVQQCDFFIRVCAVRHVRVQQRRRLHDDFIHT